MFEPHFIENTLLFKLLFMYLKTYFSRKNLKILTPTSSGSLTGTGSFMEPQRQWQREQRYFSEQNSDSNIRCTPRYILYGCDL